MGSVSETSGCLPDRTYSHICPPRPGASSTLRTRYRRMLGAGSYLSRGLWEQPRPTACFSSVPVFNRWITGPSHPQEAEVWSHLLGWEAALFPRMKQYNSMGGGVVWRILEQTQASYSKNHLYSHTHPCHCPWREPLHSQALKLLGGLRRGCLRQGLEPHSLGPWSCVFIVPVGGA